MGPGLPSSIKMGGLGMPLYLLEWAPL
jgi:hypothetical protein